MSLKTWWQQRRQAAAAKKIQNKPMPPKTSDGVVAHTLRKANSDRV